MNMMTTQSILAQGQQRQPVLGGEIWLVGAGPGDVVRFCRYPALGVAESIAPLAANKHQAA
ncbi:Uroporphyrinogen-III methyltransferase [Brenneria goodwinii]|uniref:Uroporphyrinogen-III methyltransferase n=2 Tax=Brenneria goodwinii TaxID=1109412 RepID=A0A0G4K0Q7_9GAMM|nr:Uroporphyrinogen-III methyltransferase [Brenneria goodwinii]